MKYYVTTIDEIFGEMNPNEKRVPLGYWREKDKNDHPDPYQGWIFNQALKKWIKWESYSHHYERLLPTYRTLLTNKHNLTSADDADITIILSAICPCCDRETPNEVVKHFRKIYDGPILIVFVCGSPSEISSDLQDLDGVLCIKDDDPKKVMNFAKQITN